MSVVSGHFIDLCQTSAFSDMSSEPMGVFQSNRKALYATWSLRADISGCSVGTSAVMIDSHILDLNTIEPVPTRVLGIFRHLRDLMRRLNGVSVTYHVAPPFTSLTSNIPVLVFSSKQGFSLKNSSPVVLHVAGAVHDMVLSKGQSTTYTDIVELVKGIDRSLLDRIQSGLDELGIRDELMIPCYGHHGINGCLCFSFPYPVADLHAKDRQFLEGTAHIAHQRLVSAYFARAMSRETALSTREFEIIGWIAKSKSSTDIATIMNISVATVETYIKRIFKKLNVNNRISAVIAVLASGKLHN